MRLRRLASLVLPLGLLASARHASAVVAARGGDAPVALADDLRAALLDALRPGSASDDEALSRACVLRHGTAEPLRAALDALLAAGAERTEDERTAARRLAVHVAWRAGDLAGALERLEPLAVDGGTVDDRLLRARLLDALGRTDEATEAYRTLLADGALDAAREEQVRLRLALMESQGEGEGESALAAYARGRDAAARNRAAVVLGLVGRPGEALALSVLPDEPKARTEALLRRVEWALAAEDLAAARAAAHEAVAVAPLARERTYASALLVEAYRAGDALPELLADFAARRAALSETERERWIAVLRETGRAGEALELLDDAGSEGMDRAEQREVLELLRASGDVARTVDAYRARIAAEPRAVEWREGLARVHLEGGDREAALAVWEPFVRDPGTTENLLWGAESLLALGLDALAAEAAERVARESDEPWAALLFLHRLHAEHGRTDEALGALARIEAAAPAGHPARLDLAEAYERAGLLERAVSVLEGVRTARGDDLAEDLDMRLAWLYSEVGREDSALALWRELSQRIQSVPRRRYAEDRMMTVAARLGSLADIAIELEERLLAGSADQQDANLLVRLYTKVADPVSAAEIVDEFLKRSGGTEVEGLQEKARVYVACADFYHYERTIERLMEVDPEGRLDYLQQLAMSQLERGKPDEARAVLVRMRAEREAQGGAEDDEASDEFEAGVLALAGLRAEAITAYARGLARHPERIDSYLLMAKLQRELNETQAAIGTFQFLAETTTHDDLFTVAIDGLLNMEAPAPVLRWARRITLERLAGGESKMYLFQLLADLGEELADDAGRGIALESSLAAAGPRRTSVLRELMDLATARGDAGRERLLRFGRRLVSLDDVVPPGVYLDLGEAFLGAGEVVDAERTFQLAHDLPDYDQFQRDAAGLFDTQGYPAEALRAYERVLVSRASDVALMAKVGELSEQLDRDARARELYARGLELLLQRRALTSDKVEQEETDDDPFARMWGARNVDDFEQHFQRLLTGYLTVLDPADARGVLAQQRVALEADLSRARDADPSTGASTGASARLARHPRIADRARFHRRLAFATGLLADADASDRVLLAAYPEDEDLLEELVVERVRAGLLASARAMLASATPSDEVARRLTFLVGAGRADAALRELPLSESSRLVLPRMLAGDRDGAAELVRRTGLAGVTREELPGLQVLFSVARVLGDEDLLLSVGRQWVRLALELKVNAYELEPVLARAGAAVDSERRAALYQYLVALVLEHPEDSEQYLMLLPKLQATLAGPLVDEEELLTLFESAGEGGYGYALAPGLALLPAEARVVALRSLWPKIQKTSRAVFLLSLPARVSGPLGEGLSEFLLEALPGALEDADEVYPYSVLQLAEEKEDGALVRELQGVLARKRPDDVAVRVLGAVLAARDGAPDAVERGAALFVELGGGDPDDWERQQAVATLLEELLPEHLAAFSAALEADLATGSKSLSRAMRRVELAQYDRDDPDSVRAALRRCAEEFPDDVEPLEQLLQYSSRDPLEALDVLARLSALEPERRRWHEDAARRWEALEQHARALAERRLAEALPEEGGAAAAGRSSAVMRVSGGMVVLGSALPAVASRSASAADGRRQKPATMPAVRDALEAGDTALARLTLRRLWRGFQRGERTNPFFVRFYGWGSGRYSDLPWPRAAQAKDPKEPNQGGLLGFREDEPADVEPPPRAWHVLAEHDFAVEEMERFLRTLAPRELDGYQTLCEGLLRARVRRAGGAAPVLEELLQARREGRGGKLDAILVLGLLDEDPSLATDEVHGLLGELIDAVSPLDGRQLERLARVHARRGDRAAALALYRWCATLTSDSSRRYGEGPVPLDAEQLVEEVSRELDGEDRDAAVDAVLTYADPGAVQWERERFEVLALSTWRERYGPAEALRRGRAMCEDAVDFDTGLRRRTAVLASGLFAASGELDLAVRALEAGLCKLDAALFANVSDPYFYFWPDGIGSLSDRDLRQLFPPDASRAWLEAARDGLLAWWDAERLNEFTAVRALALIARRLAAADDVDAARALAARVCEHPLRHATTGLRLWAVDAAREAGDEPRARALEEELLDAGELPTVRVLELVRRVREGDGPAAALALGTRAARRTHAAGLLDALVEAAEGAGDPLAAEAWRAARQAEEAARAELERLDSKEREQQADGEEE